MASPGRPPPPSPIRLGTLVPAAVQNAVIGNSPLVAFGTPGRAPPPRPILLQPGPVLPRQQTADRQVNALQEGLRVSTAQAKGNPLGACLLLQNLSFTGNQTKLVPHGLGRAFVSALVLCPSTNAAISFERPSGIAQDETYIAITSYASVVFDLLVL